MKRIERAYTVKDIDDLRKVVDNRLTYGTSNLGKIPLNRLWRSPDKMYIEELVRTYMLAGITANDIIKLDTEGGLT